MSGRIQAPRGTYDVLGEDASARVALEGHARRILERAGYARIETPAFEATELFARGVGESTDVVQKEMYTLDEGSEGSFTLRPEGTAPVCRAYLEHGMHKLPQPVKLWYLSSFFRRERPQKGRFRQFWQVGAEAIGSDDPAVDAEAILLLSELLEALGCRGVRLRIGSLGTPETRRAYREELQSYLRAHEARAGRGGRRADRPEPAARVRLRPPRDAGRDGRRAAAAGPADRRRRGALRDGLRAARRGRPGLRGRRHARARARLLHAHGVRVHLGRARRAVRGRRRRPLRRPDRADRRPAHARHRLGERRRADAARPRARSRAAPAPLDLYVAYAAEEQRIAAFRLAADARRAGYAARLELGGRSLKGQLKQAGNAGARYVAILREDGTFLRDMETGDQQQVEIDTVMHHIGRIQL